MKVNLDTIQRIRLENGSPIGEIIYETNDLENPLNICFKIKNYEKTIQPSFSVQFLKNSVTVIYLSKGDSQVLFTQRVSNSDKKSILSKRRETLESQKSITVLPPEWKKLLIYLEEKNFDWIFPLLYSPPSYSSTEFARLFGYQSFFFRWFISIQKSISSDHYEAWKKYFQGIYHDDHLKKDLYWTHFYILQICNQIIQILPNLKYFKDLDLKTQFLAQQDPMNHFFDSLNTKELSLFQEILSNALTFVLDTRFPEKVMDLMNIFYQELITFSRRHTLGEFYTHSELSKHMVQVGYSIGDTVLDPCCGSGTFLLEIIKYLNQHQKLSHISKLHGTDIHPLSILITKINISIAILTVIKHNEGFKKHSLQILSEIFSNIVQEDFLFNNSKKKYDLIIGNPPWIVINGINSEEYKENLKILARKMHIFTDSQNTSNLEISSLFLEKITSHHMKSGSKVFLIVSAGMLNGSQNERVRRFSKLKQIQFWEFDRDLFNVHNICILAQYGLEDIQKKYRILVKTKHISENSRFETKLSKYYIPTYIRIREKFFSLDKITSVPELEEWGVGRFIPEQKKTLIVKKSDYHDEFRQGACIGPRNLLFITPIQNSEEGENTHKIYPDFLVKSKKYGGWDYRAYESVQIERHYIHFVAKSTELIPFVLLRLNSAFLPFSQDPSTLTLLEGRKTPLTDYDIDRIFKNHPKAKVHYKFLHELYSQKKKSGSSVPDLFLNMNYNNKLLQENQRKPRKVIYNGIGSKVKAAYLIKDALIDSSLYYFIPNSDMEAFYLVGILNSPTITEFTTHMGSTGAGGSLRNIHKNPFKCNILNYQETPAQKLVAKLSRSIETYVQHFCIDRIQKNFLNSLDLEFCEFCGKFVSVNKISKHQESCKSEITLHHIKEIIESLSLNDKKTLSNKDIFHAIILGQTAHIDKSLREKVRIILGYVIKPKTLQNQLRKDEKYLKKIKVLDVAVKHLWK